MDVPVIRDPVGVAQSRVGLAKVVGVSLGFLHFLGRPWVGSGGDRRCVAEIFYISASLNTHASRHHWGVIVPLGACDVSRPSRHRSIGPGVTTLGSIVLDDCQWAESGKCGPILMMMPDTCFPRD